MEKKTNAQVALEAAALVYSNRPAGAIPSSSTVTAMAEDFFKWLDTKPND